MGRFLGTVIDGVLQGMESMGSLAYVFCGVLIGISILSVIFCIVYGKGASHKKLVFSVSMLGIVVALCFGGEVVLNLFGMGWRCVPFNTMLFIGSTLFIVILCFGMRELIVLKNANPVVAGLGFSSMLLAIFITLISAFLYFQFFSWHDKLSSYDSQTIVCANDMHGGSCSWRYYNHINGLVHGVEIVQDGWWGTPPFQ